MCSRGRNKEHCVTWAGLPPHPSLALLPQLLCAVPSVIINHCPWYDGALNHCVLIDNCWAWGWSFKLRTHSQHVPTWEWTHEEADGPDHEQCRQELMGRSPQCRPVPLHQIYPMSWAWLCKVFLQGHPGLCGLLFSLLIYKGPQNNVDFTSWPLKTKTFTIRPFTE